jgi:hypothetical protein
MERKPPLFDIFHDRNHDLRGGGMAEPQVSDRYSPDPNILECKAAEYLARLDEGGSDAWRERTRAEADSLNSITRWSVAYAAIAGIISGGLIGGAEVWMRFGYFDGEMEDMDWTESLPYWIALFAFAGVISAIEIVFLYAVAIRGIARITSRSGVPLNKGGYSDLFGRGLARAALEFPNPRVLVYGIDPYAYMPGWWIAAKNIAYKMKVGVTSFLLRVFLRRVAARMAVRGMVPLIAGPLYALWNAYIIWRILHEARLRTLGPFAVHELMHQIAEEERPWDPAVVEVMMEGVGEMIMRGHDAHPNQVFLMSRLREELGYESDEVEVDWRAQIEKLPELSPSDQDKILNVLILSALIGSKVYRSQKKLLREACAACGRTFRPEKLKGLRDKLREGRAITRGDYASVRT